MLKVDLESDNADFECPAESSQSAPSSEGFAIFFLMITNFYSLLSQKHKQETPKEAQD